MSSGAEVPNLNLSSGLRSSHVAVSENLRAHSGSPYTKDSGRLLWNIGWSPGLPRQILCRIYGAEYLAQATEIAPFPFETEKVHNFGTQTLAEAHFHSREQQREQWEQQHTLGPQAKYQNIRPLRAPVSSIVGP